MQHVIFQLVLTAVGILGGQLSQISQARACAFLGSGRKSKNTKNITGKQENAAYRTVATAAEGGFQKHLRHSEISRQ